MVEGHRPTRATLNKPIFILFLKSVGTVYTSYLHSASPFCYDRVTLQARPTFLCINTLVKARQSEHAHGLLSVLSRANGSHALKMTWRGGWPLYPGQSSVHAQFRPRRQIFRSMNERCCGCGVSDHSKSSLKWKPAFLYGAEVSKSNKIRPFL